MADETLPTEFDAIVLGTGLPESIVSAALSRIGKKVLHLDRNQYYGGQWATFSFEEFLNWAQSHKNISATSDVASQSETEADQNDAEREFLCVPPKDHVISNIVISSFMKNAEQVRQELLARASAESRLKDDEDKSNDDEPDKVSPSSSPSEPNQEEPQMPLDESNKQDNTGDADKPAETSSVSASEHEASAVESHLKPNDKCTNEVDEKKDVLERGEVETEEGSDNSVPETDNATTGEEVGENANETSEFLSPAENRLISQSRISSHSRDITLEDLLCLSRKFNIDIAPKLMYARGPLIEILINANICHYADFRTAERILTFKENEVVNVPCSRADVFNSEMVSVIEKRFLMKFLSFCLTFDENPVEYSEFVDRPFQEFLQHKKLSSNLQHFVLHSMAMVKPSTNTIIGLRETQRFLVSLGRYSNSPFVLTLYGVGEIPQAFCRMSAVFGGTYCLRRSAKSLIINKADNSFQGIYCSRDQEITAKHLIIDKTYLPEKFQIESRRFISRAVLITDKSLKDSEEEHVTLMTIPPKDNHSNSVRIIEVGPSSMGCPIGLFVVHLTCVSSASAHDDLKPYVDLLFDEFNVSESNKPRVLWSAYFNHDDADIQQQQQQQHPDLPENIFVTSLPGASLGFDNAVREAREIFDKICPDCEFLPAVPNPEDIIWDDTRKQLNPGGTIADNEEHESEEQGRVDNQERDDGNITENQAEIGACDNEKEDDLLQNEQACDSVVTETEAGSEKETDPESHTHEVSKKDETKGKNEAE